MSKAMTYDKAYAELEHLVAQIEQDEIQVDVLAEKVKQARTLIAFCEERLHKVETEIQAAKGE